MDAIAASRRLKIRRKPNTTDWLGAHVYKDEINQNNDLNSENNLKVVRGSANSSTKFS